MTRFRWSVLWFALLLGVGGWTGLRLRQEGAVRSDLLALLPKESKDGAAEAAVIHLSQAAGNRAFLLVISRESEGSTRAAATAAATLRASGAFARVVAEMPAPETKGVLTFLKDKGPLLAPKPTPDLPGAFLKRGYGTFSTTGTLRLSDDPFGFASGWLTAMPWPQANFRWQEGYLTTTVPEGTATLVVLELGEQSGRYEKQSAVVQAVSAAERSLSVGHPGATLRRLGGVFYAEAAQREARADTDRIGLGSAIGVVLLMLLVFRSLSMLATGLLSIAAGVVVGTATVLGVFGEIHLVTLVFGVSLIGEASDYSIQLLSAKLSDEEAGQKDWLRRVTPGLGMALGTSLLGYAAMTFMPLPSIRQIAAFALAGLAAAFVTVLLAGPATANVLRGGRVSEVFGRLAGAIRRFSARLGRGALWTGVAVFALGVFLATRVTTDDDVQSLIHRPAQLVEDEAAVKQALGADLSNQFLLIHPTAGTDEACLRSMETLRATLQGCREAKILEGWTSLAEVTPSQARQEASLAAYRERLGRDQVRLQGAFEEVGFTAPAGFWEAQPAFLEPTAFLATKEGMAFRHLRFEHQGKVLHLATLRGVARPDELRTRLAGMPDVTVVDKTWSIGRLLGDVRRQGVVWMSVAFLLALAVLSLRYGIRRSLILLLPTAIGVAWAPVLTGACGLPFSVFGLMALVLVLGVGVNYSIFLWEGGDRSKAALAGVIASCCTTLLSFGLLAFCGMPALRWLGANLTFGILLAFLLTPLALIGREE